MRKVTLRAHEERLIAKALKMYRNQQKAEQKYDGVSVPHYNRMSQRIRDCDSLLVRLMGGDE